LQSGAPAFQFDFFGAFVIRNPNAEVVAISLESEALRWD
jgi:hypothetical protein